VKRAVSIIICTKDRAGSLGETLESVGRAAVPGGWDAELIVVDNGSTDDTRQIVADAGLGNMPVRYVLEPRAGKGYAYNRGIAESGGEVLLWTDDDVRVPANWIDGMCRPIVEGQADAVQGGVRPAPALRRPWLTDFLKVWVGEIESVDGPASLLVGANMAFARKVLKRVPAFDAALGPGALGFFDDTLFGWQLAKASFRLRGTSAATVEHHFAPERLTLESFLIIAQRMARSRAYVMHHWEHEPPPDSWLEAVQANAALAIHAVGQRAASLGNGSPRREFVFDVYRRELLRERARLAGTPRRYERHGLSLLPLTQQEPTGSQVCV
jgi:glycosyltransferase involved in cell wall biosynthesis